MNRSVSIKTTVLKGHGAVDDPCDSSHFQDQLRLAMSRLDGSREPIRWMPLSLEAIVAHVRLMLLVSGQSPGPAPAHPDVLEPCQLHHRFVRAHSQPDRPFGSPSSARPVPPAAQPARRPGCFRGTSCPPTRPPARGNRSASTPASGPYGAVSPSSQSAAVTTGRRAATPAVGDEPVVLVSGRGRTCRRPSPTSAPPAAVLADWLSMHAPLGVASRPSFVRTSTRRAVTRASQVPSASNARKKL